MLQTLVSSIFGWKAGDRLPLQDSLGAFVLLLLLIIIITIKIIIIIIRTLVLAIT